MVFLAVRHCAARSTKLAPVKFDPSSRSCFIYGRFVSYSYYYLSTDCDPSDRARGFLRVVHRLHKDRLIRDNGGGCSGLLRTWKHNLIDEAMLLDDNYGTDSYSR
ncbi:hypothetical protein DTO169C6_5606 [Paecilomyces variotii]|nr:hypothetical protein DTO169C6_5606 [Paecilomyces variotii]KAJ9400836.1 hypothetical protein DTO282F9_2106 [Paecilomyces variotii]